VKVVPQKASIQSGQTAGSARSCKRIRPVKDSADPAGLNKNSAEPGLTDKSQYTEPKQQLPNTNTDNANTGKYVVIFLQIFRI